MARFLFAAWPFAGEVYPPLSVARALQDRGHATAFYTGTRVKTLLEGEGCTVFPFQQLDEERVWKVFTALENQTAGWRGARSYLTFLRRWLVESMPAQVDDLQAAVSAWQPDVIVASPYMYGAVLILRETLAIPVAIATPLLFCLIPGADAPPFGPGLPAPRDWRTRLLARTIGIATELSARGLRRHVDVIRMQYGLAPLNCPVSVYTARLPLYLIPSIRELDFNRGDLPPSVRYVGPFVWNSSSTAELPASLRSLSSDLPWVLVSEGTLHYQDPFVLRAAAQGLGGRPMHVILTTGTHRRPEMLNLGQHADNVIIEQWVSYAELLPRCSVVVTTGGAGTILAALRAGVPLVIIPTALDKPDNAQRAVEAGVAVRLAPRLCTPERLRAAVETVLSEPRYRTNAQRLARLLAHESGPLRAAELLEGLVQPPAPRAPQ